MKRLAYVVAVCIPMYGCLGSGGGGTSGSSGGGCSRCVNKNDCAGTDVCIDGCCSPPFGNPNSNSSSSGGSGSGSGTSTGSGSSSGSGSTA